MSPKKFIWDRYHPDRKRLYRKNLKEEREKFLRESSGLLNSPDISTDEFGREITVTPPHYIDPDPPKPFLKKQFIKISRELFLVTAKRDLLTISEIRVLLFILAKCNFNNEFIYHNKDIAYDLNLDFQTISRALKKLRNLGYIVKSQEFIGYQIYTRFSWKGSEQEFIVQRRLEEILDDEESYQRKERGETDKYGYDIPPEEKKE